MPTCSPRACARGEILLLTFTNKAAKEMLHRVQDLTGIEPARFWGGTFHSLGNRALRMFGDAIQLPKNFTILDADESETLLKQSVESVDKVFFKDKTNPRPGPLFSVLSLARNTQLSIRETVDRSFPQYGEIVDRLPGSPPLTRRPSATSPSSTTTTCSNSGSSS